MRWMMASVVCAAAMAAVTAMAQAPATPPPSGPVAEAKRNYENVKANILKSADKMPADSFSYKPEPDVRTFARVLTHVIEAQMHTCGAVNGIDQKSIVVPEQTADKDTIVTALKASFAECDKAFASTPDDKALETISIGPAKRTRIGALWGNASHDNEQYATLALYLRLKGIAPPSSEK